MKNEKPKPISLAMIICDMIMDDRKTGKKILVGTFNTINARNFPALHLEMHIFLTLTEGHGEYQSSLKCIRSDFHKPIMEISGPIKFLSPLDVVEIGFALKNLAFPSPGTYIFQLSCDSDIIASRKFMVKEIGEQER